MWSCESMVLHCCTLHIQSFFTFVYVNLFVFWGSAFGAQPSVITHHVTAGGNFARGASWRHRYQRAAISGSGVYLLENVPRPSGVHNATRTQTTLAGHEAQDQTLRCRV